MKNFTIFSSAAIFSLTLSGAAFAETFIKGTVKKINAEAGKVTLIHEELVNLEMPAMTMVFAIGDPAMLTQLEVGKEIEFTADRVNGKLTVTAVK